MFVCRVHGASHRSPPAENCPRIRKTMSKKELASVDGATNEGAISSSNFFSTIALPLNLMPLTIRIESNEYISGITKSHGIIHKLFNKCLNKHFGMGPTERANRIINDCFLVQTAARMLGGGGGR